MSIKTTLHGHFADPDSTMDITGLTGKHIQCLVNILQTCRLGGDMLGEMSIDDARQYFQSFNPSNAITDEELKESIAVEMQAANHLNQILEAIKQPSTN